MNGVMRLGVSAGSNHVGASDTCTAYVSCPEEAAAACAGAAAVTTAMATRTARAMRRLQCARRSFMSGLGLLLCACRCPAAARRAVEGTVCFGGEKTLRPPHHAHPMIVAVGDVDIALEVHV